ncbi:TOTE conflict system archaeo-eukaryotic primase domain-containing protein [Enterococcus massiliensis]|uniref:TOTE conflict system archaeo-eukaryotic primase domain-containing protein n=1 Tax=Enterococcus massiliensis TaxID=1640685 RepID=UPI00065E7511|nr:DEAD/DEAH box helicase family protein [Enterococcus massiliensis]
MKKYVRLKNGQELILLKKLSDLFSGEQVFIVEDSSGTQYSITQASLENHMNHKGFSKEEKLNLFKSYFTGRQDVFAKRWGNGKGYSPYCRLEWSKNPRCPKNDNPKYKCIECPIRQFVPYDDETINKHIMNDARNNFYGIYPLLEDDTSHFVVIDFDKGHAEEEAKSFVETCQRYDITPLIERSQSGNGIHIWLFFKEKIPASKGRRLANLLLTDAMMHTPLMNFTAYDRIIPLQDTLPKGGFGNLIALPLKWENVKKGCSIFLTDQFQTLQPTDLWNHLSKIPKYDSNEIDDRITEINSEVLILEYEFDENRYLQTMGHKKKYPAKLQVKRSGELQISLNGVSREDQIRLMFLATFKNPEYYKLQRMRAPIWNIPRLLTAAKISNNMLFLPRGIEETMCNLMPEMRIDDLTSSGVIIDVEFVGELRNEQVKAIQSIAEHDLGIISARTGFGKTVLAAYMIAKRKVSTLILVHNQNLSNQWFNQLQNFLRINSEPFKEYTPTGRVRKKEKIGTIFGNKFQQTKVIDVASIQKLSKMSEEERNTFFTDYGMVIIDECHHIAAFSFDGVIKQAACKYILGLSATPKREDGLTPIINMRCGPLRYESSQLQEENVLIKQYLYPRYTSIGELGKEFKKLSYVDQLSSLSKSINRTQQIVEDIVANFKTGRTCLVLSERVDHLQLIEAEVSKHLSSNDLYKLIGAGNKKNNKNVVSELLDRTTPYILFATGKYAGEGFDLPQLDTLFLTLPFQSEIMVKQYAGRLQRNLKNKDELRIYDYVDISNVMFARMYRKRTRFYKQLNYELAEDEFTRKYQAHIYDGNNYCQFFKEDVQNTKETIFIAIPKLNSSLVGLLKQNLAAKFTVVTTIPSTLNGRSRVNQQKLVEKLPSNSVIKFLPTITQAVCILDRSICWYGNISFLNNSNREQTSLRIINEQLAKEFIDGN